MRTLDEALDHFAYHPATPAAAAKYDRIRSAYQALVTMLWHELPDGQDKTIVLRQLHITSMLTISTVAVHETPADWTHAHVARVLPSDG